MKAVLKNYPQAEGLKIAEVFKPKEGWIRIWGQNLVDLTHANVARAAKEGATHINVRLIDGFGVERFPDYSVKELL